MRNRRDFSVAAIFVTAIALFVQLVAVRLAAPSVTSSDVMAGTQVVQNPQNPAGPLVYVALMLVATGAILLLRRIGLDGILSWVTAILVWDVSALIVGVGLGTSTTVAAMVGVAVAAIYMQWHPWWLISGLAIAFGGFVAAILGQNFGIVPALVLLAVTALYDYIAVFETEHMQSLADTVMSLRAPLPALVLLPLSLEALRRDKLHAADEDVVSVGLGDFALPATLTVSASLYLRAPGIVLSGVWVPLPAVGAALGLVVGMLGVLALVYRSDGAQPGLPFINAGATGGFLLVLGVLAWA